MQKYIINFIRANTVVQKNHAKSTENENILSGINISICCNSAYQLIGYIFLN